MMTGKLQEAGAKLPLSQEGLEALQRHWWEQGHVYILQLFLGYYFCEVFWNAHVMPWEQSQALLNGWVSMPPCSAPARADLHHFLPACLCKKEPRNGGLSNPGRKMFYFTCALIYASKWKLVLTFATGVQQVFCDQTGFLCSENGDSSPARARAGQISYFKKMGQHNARSLNLLRYFFCQILKRNSFGE